MIRPYKFLQADLKAAHYVSQPSDLPKQTAAIDPKIGVVADIICLISHPLNRLAAIISTSETGQVETLSKPDYSCTDARISRKFT